MESASRGARGRGRGRGRGRPWGRGRGRGREAVLNARTSVDGGEAVAVEDVDRSEIGSKVGEPKSNSGVTNVSSSSSPSDEVLLSAKDGDADQRHTRSKSLGRARGRGRGRGGVTNQRAYADVVAGNAIGDRSTVASSKLQAHNSKLNGQIASDATLSVESGSVGNMQSSPIHVNEYGRDEDVVDPPEQSTTSLSAVGPAEAKSGVAQPRRYPKRRWHGRGKTATHGASRANKPPSAPAEDAGKERSSSVTQNLVSDSTQDAVEQNISSTSSAAALVGRKTEAKRPRPFSKTRGRGRGGNRNVANSRPQQNRESSPSVAEESDSTQSSSASKSHGQGVIAKEVSAKNTPTSSGVEGDAEKTVTRSQARRRKRGRLADGSGQSDANTSSAENVSGEHRATLPCKGVTSSRDGSEGMRRFSDLPVCPELLRSLEEVFHYDKMTPVQATAIPLALDGKDLVAKSSTRTGKTLAFLIPSLHHLKGSKGLELLVISPTRDLAMQTGKEARQLLTYASDVLVKVVTGGQGVQKDLTWMQKETPHLLIGTPGRLNNLMKNESFASMLQTVRIVVLDETDYLLDMGFASTLKWILQRIPGKRQTLLFSGTLLDDVCEMADFAVKKDRKVVDCVVEADYGQIEAAQSVLVTDMEEEAAALGVLLIQCMQVADYKIMVFFPTAIIAQFFAQLFEAMGRPVLQIHSRKSQQQRKRDGREFANGKEMIMFTSDVSAKGINYPDVTSVIQVGLTDRGQYLQRLGRTKRGSGVLLLNNFEGEAFLGKAKDLPLTKIKRLPGDAMRAVHGAANAAVGKVDMEVKKGAYEAWLRFYSRRLEELGIEKEVLVQLAKRWSEVVLGLKEVPVLTRAAAGERQVLRAGTENGDGRGNGGAIGRDGIAGVDKSEPKS